MPARPTRDPRLGVLFLQSQAFFGADSAIHAQLMRHLDRRVVNVHCACTTEHATDRRMSALSRIAQIPDLHVRPTDFGPSVYGRPLRSRIGGGAHALRATAGAIGLVRYGRRERIDIVHGTEKPRDAFLGVWLARAIGARMVVQMHVGLDDWISPRVRWALRAADGVIGVSRFVSESIVRAGYPAERVFTVHNSLDLAEGTWDSPRGAASTRAELGIASDAPVICIASRLFRWKGHHDLVDALARVRQRFPDVRLLVVGEDDPRANPGFGGYRAELDARIAELGLGQSVVFTGFRTDVADLMAAADVFCQPSAEEPFGMVYLEAMAVRRPVVAYASGGAPEVIADGETGLLAKRGDIDGLAAALTRLLENEPLRRQMGEAGRARVERVFNPAASAATLLEVYRAVAPRRNEITGAVGGKDEPSGAAGMRP